MRQALIWLRNFFGATQMARRVYRYLPSAKRCKECMVPFLGPFSIPFHFVQIRPSRKNPNLCTL